MAGYLPRSSQVWKNGDQSMYAAIWPSGKPSSFRAPRNSGLRISDFFQSIAKRLACASAKATS